MTDTLQSDLLILRQLVAEHAGNEGFAAYERVHEALARRDGGAGEEPFMYAYECVDDGRWQAYRHQLKRADGSVCPGVALYRHPAPASVPGDGGATLDLLRRFRDLMVAQPKGVMSHHHPIWAEVADALAKIDAVMAGGE